MLGTRIPPLSIDVGLTMEMEAQVNCGHSSLGEACLKGRDTCQHFTLGHGEGGDVPVDRF